MNVRPGLVALFFGLAAILLSACAQPERGAVVLTYGTPYGPGHPFSQADQEWMKWVEAESGGTLKITTFWSGGLLSSDESMLEVRHGVVDIGLITPIYARGGAQVLRVQAGFYGGVRTYADQLRVYDCMATAFPEFSQETEGLVVLAVQGGNLPGVLTRDRPVRNLDDFRGLRLRAPSELTGLLAKLGADPVNMPMGEVYSALAKGVIDGVVAPADTLRSLHFNEVAKHFTQARIARGAYPARAMSLRSWQRLSPGHRDILERSRAVWEQAMMERITKAEAVGVEFGREQGTDFIAFPDAEQQKLDQLYTEEARAAARKVAVGSGDAAPILETAQDYIRRMQADPAASCPIQAPGDAS